MHDQQGHELRHGDRHGEACTPEALAASGLAVDDHGHEHAEEEVQERGEERPHQGPDQHSDEQSGIDGAAAVGEYGGEVLQADPIEKNQILMVIAGECHGDHEDQRQHGEDRNTQRRQEHQQQVRLGVEQFMHIVHEARGLAVLLHLDLGLVGSAHG